MNTTTVTHVFREHVCKGSTEYGQASHSLKSFLLLVTWCDLCATILTSEWTHCKAFVLHPPWLYTKSNAILWKPQVMEAGGFKCTKQVTALFILDGWIHDSCLAIQLTTSFCTALTKWFFVSPCVSNHNISTWYTFFQLAQSLLTVLT